MLNNHRMQHCVGQGLFHSGQVEFCNSKFTYVYDCGSENKKSLGTEIKQYANITDGISALFISHLDNDHVNGLDQLLMLQQVDTIVLPYMSKYERLFLAALTLDEENTSFNYISILNDPIRWFGARGVRRVIFMRGDGEAPEQIEGFAPHPPDDHPPTRETMTKLSEEGHLEFSWPEFQGNRIVPRGVLGPRSPEVYVLDHRIPLHLTKFGYSINWGFLTYVHPEPIREILFRDLFWQEFQYDLSTPAGPDWIMNFDLFGVLRRSSERKRLARCYLAIRHDRNLTSMALYSGPFVEWRKVYSSYNINARGVKKKEQDHSRRQVAWLGTGDANLSIDDRMDAFLTHYSHVLKYIGTVMVPHRGSKHNFHDNLLLPTASYYFVGAGTKNRHEHPDPTIRSRIRDAGKNFIQTSEDPSSRMAESVTLQWSP